MSFAHLLSKIPSLGRHRLERAVAGKDFLLHPDFDIREVELPEASENAAGMISNRERLLLYLLTKAHFDGSGFIIDAGMFLGASAVCLAEGLRDNPNCRKFASGPIFGRMKPVQGYERGIIKAPKRTNVNLEKRVGDFTYKLGESFVPIIEKQTEKFQDLVGLNIGDFNQARWNIEDPIEICFIDLAKTPELNQHAFEVLFPAFIPGKTLLVQQDFFFDRLPWIKVLMGYLDEHFEWLGQVGPSSIYRYVKEIPHDKFLVDPYRSLSDKERIRLHKLSFDSRLSRRRKFNLDVSLAYLYGETHGKKRANAHLKSVEKEFHDHISFTSKFPVPASLRIKRAQMSIKRGKKVRMPEAS
jgi:hypothetical protein